MTMQVHHFIWYSGHVSEQLRKNSDEAISKASLMETACTVELVFMMIKLLSASCMKVFCLEKFKSKKRKKKKKKERYLGSLTNKCI